MRRWILTLGLPIIGLMLAACGEGSSVGGSYGEADAVIRAGPAVTVSLKDLVFAPKAIRVPVGTTVTWKNEEAPLHNVSSIDEVFVSPDLRKGDVFSFTFDRPGTYRYQCTYHHPAMIGVVIVDG